MTHLEARYLNILLGLWLLVSAFVWPLGTAHLVNSWIVGLVAITAAFLSLGMPAARYVCMAAGVWLFVSTVAVFRASASAMYWNDALIGLALVVLCLAGSRPDVTIRRNTHAPL